MKDNSVLYALILGMMIQAAIAGTLSAFGVINLCAEQQLICALLYFTVFLGIVAARRLISGQEKE